MKFCPECGSQLPIGTAKFCPNCGKSLWVTTSETNDIGSGAVIQSKESTATSQDSFDGIPIAEDLRGEFQEQTIHSLGIKLEETVEQILKKRGYTTEMRQKLEGNSGALHEIDVLAKRQNKVLAVECKNYNESRLVGIKEIRDFQSKMQDLPHITDAMFVTNTRFSSEAATYAKHNLITLYDGEKLKNEFYLTSIGRLDSSYAAILQQDVILDFALPLTMDYREAARLDLVNPYSAKISHATLVLRPFYVFNYIVDVKRRLLMGRGFHEEGTHIVDAMTGEILDTIEQIESKIQSYPFFSKSNMRPKDSEELLGDIEKNKIIVDLQSTKPQPKYKIHQTGEYAVVKLEAKVPIDAARRMVKEEVIEETKVKYYDDVKVVDKALSSIYVPKWVINIESQNRKYAREILAASSTILMDEIAYCPKEFFARFRSSKKQTYAVCERCGSAYCRRHIDQIKDSYYCKDHI